MLKTTLTTIKAFIAGVLAMLIFHQGLLAALHYLGRTRVSAWDMTPGWPVGLPLLGSWLVWGGIWGVLVWGLIRNTEAAGYYIGAIILGAILPGVVFLFGIMPLADQALWIAGWDKHFIAGVLLLQAFWGLGLALFMRAFKPPI